VTEENSSSIRTLRRLKPYPSYKDSGVEWLGKIPTHWEMKPLKALLTRNDGGVWGEDFDDEGVIVLRSTEQTIEGYWNIQDPARRCLSARAAAAARLACGDLVTTKSSGSQAHLGKTSIVDHEVAALGCCFSNFMQRLRVAAPHVPRFVWYFMNCPVGREQIIFQSSTTTGLGNLNGAILGSLAISTPLSEEQRAIAAFLDRETANIAALIAKNERLIELLQEKRTALITQIVTKGLDPNVPMKDSGVELLGDIPAHWIVTTLKRIGNLQAGAGFPNDEQGLQSEEIPFFKVGDMGTAGNEREMIECQNTISRAIAMKLHAFIYPVKTIVFAKVGAALLLNRRRILTEPSCIDNNMMGLIPSSCDPIWALHWLSGLDMSELANPGAVPSVNESQMRDTPVVLPPLYEQRTIAAFLDREMAKIDALVAKIQEAIDRLKEYRTALISAAVTGKIDLREIIL